MLTIFHDDPQIRGKVERAEQAGSYPLVCHSPAVLCIYADTIALDLRVLLDETSIYALRGTSLPQYSSYIHSSVILSLKSTEPPSAAKGALSSFTSQAPHTCMEGPTRTSTLAYHSLLWDGASLTLRDEKQRSFANRASII